MMSACNEDETEEPKQPNTTGSLQRQHFCRASNGHRHKPVPRTYSYGGWDRHPHSSSSPRGSSILHRSAELAVAFFAAVSLILTIQFSCLGTANRTSPLSTLPEFISEAKRTPTLTLAGGTTASRRGDENSIATAATRNIQFLYPRPPAKEKARYNQTWFKEAYSGMWWQVSKQFVETDWESGFDKMPITASFKALQKGRARQTSDWLDLCVEHLSIFWKHFERTPGHSKDSIVVPAIQGQLKEYSQRTLASCQHQGPTAKAVSSSPACSTLALLPFFGKLDQRDTGLRIDALAATLVSLWDIGVRRSVVVGHTDAEAQMVESAFDKLKAATSSFPECHSMELKFVKIHNVTDEEAKLMPKLALRGLKAAMLKLNQKDPSTSSVKIQNKEISEWLGEGSVKDLSSRFQYIYFTEPDLILHTRASALNAIRSEMDRGGVFTAHRFMPLPHQRSFKNYTDFRNVIPDSGRFADIRELDRDLHSSCDAGKYYPSNPTHPSEPLLDFPCWPLQWWKCGYFQRLQQYTDIASVAELHYRIPSPLVSLDRGTGWPLIHNNQRVCFPQARDACDG